MFKRCKSVRTLALEEEIKRFNKEVRLGSLKDKAPNVKTYSKKKKARNNIPPIFFKLKKMNTVEERLEFLKEEARKKPWDKPRRDYSFLRRVKRYVSDDFCIICGNKADCMHHIKPLICGGDNSRKNLIPVCNDCHIYIHPHMQEKEEKQESKIVNAPYQPPTIN